MKHTDLKPQIRQALSDPETVLERLGLLETAKKNHKGFLIPCPWHAESAPSCHVRRHPGDGTLAAKCFGCQRGGDVFDLIAAVEDITNFSEVVNRAQELSGVTEDYIPPPRQHVSVPAPKFPNQDELQELYFSGISIMDDTQARKWAEDRGYDLQKIAGSCRVIPLDGKLPEWAALPKRPGRRQMTWIDTGHRLLIPLYGPDGQMRSVKARNISGRPGPKNLNPMDCAVGGLSFANMAGHAVLSGQLEKASRVVFVEGETDLLFAISRDTGTDIAVFGVYSGGWSTAHADKVKALIDRPKTTYLMDRDEAGQRYQDMIVRSFL